MPTYAYHCDSCGNDFDRKQGFDADPQHECPECSNIARRRFSAPAVIYKGSGFYTTDYARKSGSSSSPSSSSGASSSPSTSSSSTSSSSSSDTGGSSDSGGSSGKSDSAGSSGPPKASSDSK